METWISKRGKRNFAIFLILSVINRCAGGLIEYSSFSDDDIMLEMQMFNEVEDIINECVAVDLEKEIYKNDLANLERMKLEYEDKMLEHLKMEINCLIINMYEYKKENAAKYLGFWAVQMLAAEYSISFINGYIRHSSSNPVLARQCFFLGRYLATIGGIPWYQQVFPRRVTHFMKSDQGCTNNPAYLTAFSVRRIHVAQIGAVVRNYINFQYIPESDTMNTKFIILHRRDKYVEFSIAKLFFAYTIFGKKMDNENTSNIPDYDQLWKSVRSFLGDLEFLAQQFDENPQDEESYLNLKSEFKGTYYDEVLAQDRKFVNLIENAKNYQKGNVIIEDDVSWNLAEELMTFFPSETSGSSSERKEHTDTSGSSSEPNNGRYESKLVKIIRTLEKKRALLHYKGNSFENSVLGFTDGAKLAFERDNNSNDKNIIYRVVKKYQ